MNPFPLLVQSGLTPLYLLILYGVISFPLFFFGSQRTARPLSWKEALAAAALLAFLVMLFSIFHSSSIYLRSHYYRIQFAGIILPAYAVLSLLIRKYDCDVVPSLLMVLGGLFLPLLILMWLISLFH